MSWAKPLRRLEVLIAKKNKMDNVEVNIPYSVTKKWATFHYIRLATFYIFRKFQMICAY